MSGDAEKLAEETVTQLITDSPVYKVFSMVASDAMLIWNTATVLEITHFVTTWIMIFILMYTLRDILARLLKSAGHTESPIDDMLIRFSLLLLSPTPAQLVDVHTVMDIAISMVLAARASFTPTEHQKEMFFTLYKLFGITRLMLSFSFHINSIMLEFAEIFKVGDLQNRGLFYIKNIARGVVWVLGSVYILQACFGIDCTSLFAGLGIGSVALALGLQSTLSSFFASAMIFLDSRLQVDDWVLLDGMCGQVRWVGLFSTKLRLKDETIGGHMLTVPNAALANAKVINYTEHEVECDTPCKANTEDDHSTSNWKNNDSAKLSRYTGTEIFVRHGTPVAKVRKVKEIVQRACEGDAAEKEDPAMADFLGATELCWCNLVEVTLQGIHWNVRYNIFYTDLQKFRDVKEEINLRVLEGLEAEGVELVGPVQVLKVDGPAASNIPHA